jgi:hypothetical protein
MPKYQKIGIVDFINATETREYNGKIYYSRALYLDVTSHDPYTGEKSDFEKFTKIEFSGQENCAALDQFKFGDVVTVDFDVYGRKYERKDGTGTDVFNTVHGFGIAIYQSNARTQQVQQQQPPVQQPAPAQPQQAEMPFPPPIDNVGNPVVASAVGKKKPTQSEIKQNLGLMDTMKKNGFEQVPQAPDDLPF